MIRSSFKIPWLRVSKPFIKQFAASSTCLNSIANTLEYTRNLFDFLLLLQHGLFWCYGNAQHSLFGRGLVHRAVP